MGPGSLQVTVNFGDAIYLWWESWCERILMMFSLVWYGPVKKSDS